MYGEESCAVNDRHTVGAGAHSFCGFISVLSTLYLNNSISNSVMSFCLTPGHGLIL